MTIIDSFSDSMILIVNVSVIVIEFDTSIKFNIIKFNSIGNTNSYSRPNSNTNTNSNSNTNSNAK